MRRAAKLHYTYGIYGHEAFYLALDQALGRMLTLCSLYPSLTTCKSVSA